MSVVPPRPVPWMRRHVPPDDAGVSRSPRWRGRCPRTPPRHPAQAARLPGAGIGAIGQDNRVAAPLLTDPGEALFDGDETLGNDLQVADGVRQGERERGGHGGVASSERRYGPGAVDWVSAPREHLS